MAIFLIDTNILIDHLRGKDKATEFLFAVHTDNDIKIALSVITRAELIAGMRPSEQDAIVRLLDLFEEIDLTRDIAQIAGLYMNGYLKSHGLNMADAVIAASAKCIGASLYTLNKKHFPMRDINIIVPYT